MSGRILWIPDPAAPPGAATLRYWAGMVLIFGKDSCPYTQAARDDYAARGIPFEYVNVKMNRGNLDRMLSYSGGVRQVPVIVEGDAVTIGFDGGT